MSIDPIAAFRAASEAAHGWLNTVSLITRLSPSGRVDVALELLLGDQLLHESYLQHAGLLADLVEDLAAVSDGPVKWDQGRGWSGIARDPSAVYPERWSSAHEAAAAIARMALSMLAWPVAELREDDRRAAMQHLLDARAGALAMTMAEVADLQERVRRERAKLLSMARGRPIESIAGNVARASADATAPPLSEFLSAVDLARVLEQPTARVEAFLRQHRARDLDCYLEVSGNRRKSDPMYLYKTARVWGVLLEKRQHDWLAVEPTDQR